MIKVTATGRLVRDANVFRYNDNEKSGVKFTIASNDLGSEDPDFLSCVIFNRDENMAQYLKMGNQVIVSGRLKSDKKGYNYCIVDDFEFGAAKKS